MSREIHRHVYQNEIKHCWENLSVQFVPNALPVLWVSLVMEGSRVLNVTSLSGCLIGTMKWLYQHDERCRPQIFPRVGWRVQRWGFKYGFGMREYLVQHQIFCVEILKLHLEYGFTRSVELVVTAEWSANKYLLQLLKQYEYCSQILFRLPLVVIELGLHSQMYPCRFLVSYMNTALDLHIGVVLNKILALLHVEIYI
jgi:hypothetical protein